MSNGELKILSTENQYIKYKYTYGGNDYIIHTFLTRPKSSQSIAPAIYTTKTPLASMNPAPVAANKVICKINGCMYEYNKNQFYGFFYQGEGYPMYFNQTPYYSVPDSHPMYSTRDYWPSFCVKKDGTATIRWFERAAKLRIAIAACRSIIGSVHPLVYNGACVMNQRVYDTEQSNTLIYDPQGTITNVRFKSGAGYPFENHKRTLLGHLDGISGFYLMACAETPMTIKVAANFMQDINCDYAVALDGGSPSEMRIKDGYGPSGKVTPGGGLSLHTAVCAYLL